MRPDDWPERLNAFIEANLHTPFAWGLHDCSQFVIKCELALFDQTKFADSIGKYKTKRGAAMHLHYKGFDSLWDYVGSRYNEITPSFAKRGDIAGHLTQDGESVGIIVGNSIACAGDDGIAFKPLSEAERFWRFD